MQAGLGARLKLTRAGAKLGSRAALTTAAYVGAAVITLLSVILARRSLPPEALRTLLGYLVITTISAGLEPGTVKSVAIAEGAGAKPPIRAVLLAGGLKSMAAGPILAAIWHFSDPHVSLGALTLTPLICTAGFCATDLRVLLDLRGRHAAAIGLKQGSTSLGVLIATILMITGLSTFLAILVATLARLLILAPLARDPGPVQGLWSQARLMIVDWRWLEFAGASALSAAGGSIDRLLGLRFLPAAAMGSYYLIFETLSRFWLLPYLLTPILFARRIHGEASGGFIRLSWGLTAIAGGGALALLGAVTALDPRLPYFIIGRPLDTATFALATAIVICSFTQLRIAELQATGATRRVIWVLTFSLIAAVPLFWYGVRAYGLAGLMWAWLARTLLEFAAASIGRRPSPGVAVAPNFRAE